MYIFELAYPGTWLDAMDRDKAWQANNLLMLIESQFTEAAVALNLFEVTRSAGRPRTRPEREGDGLAVRDMTLLGNSVGMQQDLTGSEQFERTWYAAQVAFKRGKWEAGNWPSQYIRCQVFMYAKCFVYSIDSISKLITELSKEPGVPPAVSQQRDVLNTLIPALRDVRDSAHHVEDRGRGLDRKKQPLKLKPVDNGVVRVPDGGALLLNCLNGNRFGCTTADGQYGEVEVSAACLSGVRQCIQAIIDSFTWMGPPRHYPD